MFNLSEKRVLFWDGGVTTTSSYQHFLDFPRGVDYPNIYAPFKFSIKGCNHDRETGF